jgi:hypothetical protein
MHGAHIEGREAGKLISKAERDEAVKRINIYQSWFKSTILAAERLNALVILPIEGMSPRYRDEPPK